MNKGLLATLFAGAVAVSAIPTANGAAPVITGLPDITVGDVQGSTDTNFFVFTDAFSFSSFAFDPDTPEGSLIWSFGEFSGGPLAPNSRYTINDVGPVNDGDTAIADDETNGHPNAANPGANRIDASSDLATFRDILFSPPPGSGPFPDPSPAQAAEAAAGKALRFYVADPEGNVDFQDVLINTVDNAASGLTFSDGYTEVISDTNFSGWVSSGIASDHVTNANVVGELSVDVDITGPFPAPNDGDADGSDPGEGGYRILGWQHQTIMDYDDVGAGNFVRGKFYVHAPDNSFFDPVNEVPNFRLRVTQGQGAVNAAVHYEYAQTGNSVSYEPIYELLNNPSNEIQAGYWIRPSNLPATPSLYRVDLDAVDVPASVGGSVGALFESYTTANVSDGTLALTKVTLGTYTAKTDGQGTLLLSYDKSTGLGGGTGGAKTLNAGGFNQENNFVFGRRQDLFLPPGDAGPFASLSDQGAGGLVGDTAPVDENLFGIGLLSVISTDNANRARIEAGKLYRAKFYATAPVATSTTDPNETVQGNLRFRVQTAAGSISYLLDMTGGQSSLVNDGETKQVAGEALPGIGSENPETDAGLDTAGEDGGWYTVLMSSPLNAGGIRADTGDEFYLLGDAPGPGSSEASARDITLGVDLISLPRTLVITEGGSPVPFQGPNRSVVRISAIELYEYPEIDDGGYQP